jgi:AraC-like DNA-binding protein
VPILRAMRRISAVDTPKLRSMGMPTLAEWSFRRFVPNDFNKAKTAFALRGCHGFVFIVVSSPPINIHSYAGHVSIPSLCNSDQVAGKNVGTLSRMEADAGPVGKALRFIEANLESDISLHEIAAAAGATRYHLLHAFRALTGQSVMGYLRGLRLTEAARQLAAGATAIRGVALEAGYTSHEAFTRAFSDQFSLTPRDLRALVISMALI